MKKLFLTLGLATLIPAGIGCAQSYTRPTYSSPIAISRIHPLIWGVNLHDDCASINCRNSDTHLANTAIGKRSVIQEVSK